MSKDKFSKMNDDELLTVINVPSPEYLAADRNLASIVLHERKKNKESWMLGMTALILVLTFALVYAEFYHKAPSAPVTIPAQKVQPNDLNPSEKSTAPQKKGDDTKMLSHSSTTVKK